MNKPIVEQHEVMHGSQRMYVTGFILSIILTLAAYISVTHNLFTHMILVGVLVGLAMLQFGVQLLFFLHIGQEAQPRVRVWVLLFMILVVSILVFGSLWIMHNLDYNMTRLTPSQQNIYLHNHEGL